MHLWQECEEVVEVEAAAVDPRLSEIKGCQDVQCTLCIEPGLQGKRLSKYLVFSRATGESVFNCCSDESMMQEACLGFA